MAEELRPELASALFRYFDDHGRGSLASRELLYFSEVLVGFEGNGEDWAEVYADLCAEYAFEPEAGVGATTFARMLRDSKSVAYCSEADAEAFLAKLPQAASAKLSVEGLPPIPRGPGLPALRDLPEKHRKGLQQPLRNPRVRLFCFYGAADHFANWVKRWVVEAPSWADTAVYEARGHGLREAEPLDTSMEERAEDAWRWLQPAAAQLAPGGAAEGAPFALLGHSVGCQLLTLVAARLRKELSLEPSAVFVCDRGPPNFRLWSKEGYELLRSKPLAFMDIFDPYTSSVLKSSKGTPLGEQMLRRFQSGYQLGYEAPQKEAQHKFACPITVFVCSDVYAQDAFFQSGKMKEEDMKHQVERSKLLQSRESSCAQFDESHFRDWRKWTSKSCRTVKAPGTTHFSVKDDENVAKAVWDELASICGVGSAKS